MAQALVPMLQMASSAGIPTGNLGLLSQLGLFKVITIGFVICLIGVFSISSCSIGMQCMNKNGSYKATHKSSYNFMVFSLITSLILLLMGIGIIVARIVAKVYFPAF